MHYLDKDQFLNIIDAVPLVSIDLVIQNASQEYLLGLRNNSPAKGFWFVPGGRIRKNETLTSAMRRIALNELGVALAMTDARLLGAYDHHYQDNFAQQAGVETHYVVIAYALQLREKHAIQTDDQHADIKWWSKQALLDSPVVHTYTKNYFK